MSMAAVRFRHLAGVARQNETDANDQRQRAEDHLQYALSTVDAMLTCVADEKLAPPNPVESVDLPTRIMS